MAPSRTRRGINHVNAPTAIRSVIRPALLAVPDTIIRRSYQQDHHLKALDAGVVPDVTVDGARKTRRLAQACSRSAPTEASRFDTHELTGEQTQRGDNSRYLSVKYPREFQSTAKPSIPRFREIDAGDTAKVGHN